MIARRVVLLGAAMLAVPAAVYAQPAGPAGPIAMLNQALLQAMQDGRRTPFPQRYDLLAPVIDQVFDLNAILQTSVGLPWDQLPDDQKATLAQVFRAFTVCSYAANFDSYDGQRFNILPDQRRVGNEDVVATELVGPRDKTRIDYVMRPTGGTWKAVDVLLDGSISRVAVQRSDFRSLLASGNADRLIRSLQDKVRQLSHGTVTT